MKMEEKLNVENEQIGTITYTEKNKNGAVTSERRKIASRENGKKGGRPRINKPAPGQLKIVALIPEINRKAYSELSRSASNLNQIARKLNQRGKVEIQEIYNALQSFRVALMGMKK
jgi:hypothetical protein